MPRHARRKSATSMYHIVIKGADRQLLFEEEKDYIKYLDLLEHYKEVCDFEIFAYCLMSNHVHLLIHHSDANSLSTIFRKINTAYAVWFNLKYDRTGFVQDGRFHSEPIDSTCSLLQVTKYIHLNPFKAGLEAYPGEKYYWSSFHDYKLGLYGLTDTDYILEILGTTENFLLLHETPDVEEFLDIRSFRHRIPDDVAKDIILQTCNCNSSADFQKLPQEERDNYLKILIEKGLSIRQINRLTGISRGIIERALKK